LASATDTLVREIIDVDSSITDTTPFINAASAIVEAQCSGLDASTVTIVETWLAAHLVAIRDPRAVTEKIADASETYQSKVDLGLNVTHYGQQAMMMDSTGGLSRWNNGIVNGNSGKSPGILWAGTETVN